MAIGSDRKENHTDDTNPKVDEGIIDVSHSDSAEEKGHLAGPMLVRVDSYRDDKHIDLTWRSWLVVL